MNYRSGWETMSMGNKNQMANNTNSEIVVLPDEEKTHIVRNTASVKEPAR
jgi:hypothetical protein